MSLRPVSVALYIPKGELDQSWNDLLRRINVRGAAWTDGVYGRTTGVWSEFVVDVSGFDFQCHRIVLIQIGGVAFWDFRGEGPERVDMSLDDDPATPVALAFRDTCRACGAEVGVICTRYDLADGKWLEANYLTVLMMDAWQLLGDASVLYMNAGQKAGFVRTDTREVLEDSEDDILVFSTSGRHRWM